MTIVGVVESVYNCKSCDHEWNDTKQRGFEAAAFEYSGCPSCKSKDVEWEHKEAEPLSDITPRSPSLHGTSNNLGKPPKDFVDGVLKRIKDNHQGYHGKKSSINLDW